MKINHQKNEILSVFINSLITKIGAKRILVIENSLFNIFDSIPSDAKDIFTYKEGIPTTGKWDLILANPPIGMKSELNGIKTTYTSKIIVEATQILTDQGLILSIGEPLLIRNDRNGIRHLLKATNSSLSAIINPPDGFLRPYTELNAPFLIIKKGGIKKELIGELVDTYQADQLANAFIDDVSGNSLEEGLFLEPGQFNGFHQWRVRQQIQALETEYKQFNTRKLTDLLKSINTTKPKTEFKSLSNCLYIHKVGTKPATSNIEKLTSGHSNYYQCECNEDLVDSKYLESFFGSKLGKLILNSLNTGSYIPNITLRSLSDTEVSIPPLETQKKIVNSISKLRQIREVISQFEDDLALNPIGSDQALEQIDNMLDVVGGLADSDKVMSLIRSGESRQTEFKESLTLDVKKQTKEKYIELSAIKTIAAFMNSISGTLIVGVSDTGEIHGVDHEINKFYKTHDDFLLKFRNLIKERIGAQVYDFLDYRLVKIGDKHVLLVECEEAPMPVYVDENDFYVRANPATDKLDGPKMVTYITNHFIKK